MTTQFPTSFVLATQHGDIYRWSGLADDFEHGERLAVSAVMEHTAAQVWDFAVYPLPNAEFHAINNGRGDKLTKLEESEV